MEKACFWQDPKYVPNPALVGTETTKYLIVGGGIGGLFLAHFLLEHGETDIVLIEKNTIGSGSTGHSAGMLVGEIETSSWAALVERIGFEKAKIYWRAQVEAMATVRAVATNLSVDFENEDLLFLARTHDSKSDIETDITLRQELGASPRLLNENEMRDELNVPYYAHLERLETSVSVNPLVFAHRTAEYLRERGVRIYEHTAYTGKRDGVYMTDGGGSIACAQCMFVRGTSEDNAGNNFLTTICITEPLLPEELERLRLADKDMFLDMEKRSYHYGKVTSDNRLLIGYGDVKDQHHTEDIALHEPHLRNIQRFMLRAFSLHTAIAYAWTGRYSLSPNALPHVSVGVQESSFGGAGTQLATIATASFVASRITNRPHHLDSVFGGEVRA